MGMVMRPDRRQLGKPGNRSPTKLPDLTEAFKQALNFHQTRRLSEAEKIYRQILESSQGILTAFMANEMSMRRRFA
jgi:hypothetical protein